MASDRKFLFACGGSVKEGAPTVGSARGLPAGSTAGPGSFVRDSFGNGYSCPGFPRGTRGVYCGVARGGSTLKGLQWPSMEAFPPMAIFINIHKFINDAIKKSNYHQYVCTLSIKIDRICINHLSKKKMLI